MAQALDIKEKNERNWVRVAYGFKFLKNGLASFIDQQIHQQHNDLKQSLENDSSNPAKSCTSCSSENLLPNHQTRQCIQKIRTKCFCSTWHNRRKCPNQFCSRFYDKIVSEHAEANPSWQNTDPTRWYSDHWELAKCFLGTTGYLETHSADVTGLLSIAINDLFVVNKIDNLENFKQVRKIRNEIFHKKMLEVTDEEAELYIDRMIDVLQDKRHLLHDAESQQAVHQLNKLKHNQIYISTEDAEELRKNALDTIKSVTDKCKSEIEEAKAMSIRELSLKTSEIEAVADKSKYEIEEAKAMSIRELSLKTSDIEAVTDKFKSEIEETTLMSINKITLKTNEMTKTIYDRSQSATNVHISGTIGKTHGVIDWGAIGAAASGAIMSGSSMLHSSLSAVDYRVAIIVEIENWSKYPLTSPASFVKGGQIKYPPVTVKGGQKEMFIAHKTGGTATGTLGTASWLIQNSKNKRCVVMWSAPYSFDFHSNWLGVGLTESGYAEHKDWFNQMYSGSSGSGLKFVRGKYEYNTNTIKVSDGTFEVTGTMGTSHKTKASIVFRPLNEADFADSLKDKLTHES